MNDDSENHEHEKHSTKCLRESCRIMGFELFSSVQFVDHAVHWLSEFGNIEIERIKEEEPPDSWRVYVDVVHVHSFGETLAEALCGAVQTIEVPK